MPAKKPKSQGKPLTPRQKKLVALMPKVKAGELKQEEAMKKAGYSDKTARQQSASINRIRHNSAMQEALRKAGVTEGALARKIAKGLKATRHFSANFKVHEVDDFNAQHSFVKTAAELLDAFPAKKQVNVDATLDDIIKAQEGGTLAP